MGLRRTTDAASEPITLAEAKTHLRVDHSDEDSLITALITACRIRAEDWCRRSFITQTWTLKLDRFPSRGAGRLPVSREPDADETRKYRHGVIYLERPRVIGITSINYVNLDGVNTLLASTEYQCETGADVDARLQPAYNKTWPETRDEMETVTIVYTAGYGAAASNVPEPIKQAILLDLGMLYRNRDSGDAAKQPLCSTAQALLSPYYVWSAC